MAESTGVIEDAETAIHEVAAGAPGKSSRRWLAAVAVLAFAAFAADTFLVESRRALAGFDLPIEHAVQQINWGPVGSLMTLTNSVAGWRQDIVGVVVVAVLFAFEARAGWLMALGSIGSLLDQFLKVSIARHRPTADLVQILTPQGGYSFPSGHAVFFTWLYFMLAFAMAPRVHPKWRPSLWGITALLILFACLGRVWAGVHWPSDVIGGFLLAIGWSAFVLWVPERWLPTPTYRWVRRRRSRKP